MSNSSLLAQFGADDLNAIEDTLGSEYRFRSANLGAFFSGQYGIVTYIFFFSGIAMGLYLLYGGLHFMLSRGDPKAAAAAKQTLTNAIIGMLIVFSAYWIVQILGIILGLPGITSTFV